MILTSTFQWQLGCIISLKWRLFDAWPNLTIFRENLKLWELARFCESTDIADMNFLSIRICQANVIGLWKMQTVRKLILYIDFWRRWTPRRASLDRVVWHSKSPAHVFPVSVECPCPAPPHPPLACEARANPSLIAWSERPKLYVSHCSVPQGYDAWQIESVSPTPAGLMDASLIVLPIPMSMNQDW